MSSVITVLFSLAVVVDGYREVFAEQVQLKRDGDTCAIGGQTGRWTDVSECPVAQQYVQVLPGTVQPTEGSGVLVCCALANIRVDCRSLHNHFEFTRFDLPEDGGRPFVRVNENCGSYYKEGEPCTTNNETGMWTSDKVYCDQNAEAARVMSLGCCKLRISLSKCREYTKLQNDECTDDMKFSSLAEMFNSQKMTLQSYSGVLISKDFVLTTARSIHWNDVRFVRIGTVVRTPLIAVKYSMCHPAPSRTIFYQNDVCLLRLKEPVSLSADIRPACLPQTKTIEATTHAVMSFEEQKSTMVKTLVVPMEWSKCQEHFPHVQREQHFCLLGSEGDPCWLKWGTGLIVQANDSFCTATAVAIKSSESVCLNQLFINLFPFLNWIESVVWQ